MRPTNNLRTQKDKKARKRKKKTPKIQKKILLNSSFICTLCFLPYVCFFSINCSPPTTSYGAYPARRLLKCYVLMRPPDQVELETPVLSNIKAYIYGWTFWWSVQVILTIWIEQSYYARPDKWLCYIDTHYICQNSYDFHAMSKKYNIITTCDYVQLIRISTISMYNSPK